MIFFLPVFLPRFLLSIVLYSRESESFIPASNLWTSHHFHRCEDDSLSSTIVFSQRSGDKDDKDYKFGDITRGIINRFRGRVNSLTGKSEYQFGDLSRWIDSKSKDAVAKYTSKSKYQFGDITKEIIRRLLAGEYNREDLLLLLKIAATIGINMQPVVRVLPIKVLMDLLNLSLEVSIAQTIGQTIVASLTNEIDARMKEMVTGDRKYQLGDYTKRIVSRWTGRDTYEFGDVTKTILERLQSRDELEFGKKSSISNKDLDEIVLELDKTEQDVLDAWDKEFLAYQRENEGLVSREDDEVYRDWDERYLSSQREVATEG